MSARFIVGIGLLVNSERASLIAGFVERFIDRSRNECLNEEVFPARPKLGS